MGAGTDTGAWCEETKKVEMKNVHYGKRLAAMFLMLFLIIALLPTAVFATGTYSVSIAPANSDYNANFEILITDSVDTDAGDGDWEEYEVEEGSTTTIQNESFCLEMSLLSYDSDRYIFLGWNVNGTEYTSDTLIGSTDYLTDCGEDYYLASGVYMPCNQGYWKGRELLLLYGNILDDISVSPLFREKNTASASVSVVSEDDTKGTVSVTNVDGDKWSITSIPATGYRLNYVQVGDDADSRVYSDDGTTISVEVTENTAFTAYFAPATIKLNDTIYYGVTGTTANGGSFPDTKATAIFAGQRVRISVPYSVLGNAEVTKENSTLKVYSGEDATGQLLYDGSLVSNFAVDPMPQISKITMYAALNGGETSVKTYNIQVGTSETVELTNTGASGNGYNVAAFWNETSSVLNLYYATSGGVYLATADGVAKMDGTQGEAIAVGGASEDALYAITTTYDYSSAGYTYYLTYHLYEYVNDQWSQLDGSYAVKETSGMDHTKYQSALIMDGRSIWLGDVHWDGDSWETNDVSFNSFWKADADTAYAGSSNGVYQYKNGSWMQISGTSGTMYITSGACTGETVTMVTAESRKTSIDRISKNYYDEKSGGTTKKVVISDTGASVTPVDITTIPGYQENMSSTRQYVGVAADGELYAITVGRSTEMNSFLSYSGSYLYKLVDGVWVYQDVPAYNNSSKDYIRHFTSPCEGVTVFLGFQGCNYIYYSGQTTITFDSNGGSEVEPITGTIGSAVTAPKSPTKDGGFVFLGWYSDAELKNPWTWNVMPARDVTLYAKWLDRNNPGASEDLDKERERAKAGLNAALARLTKTDYSDENWQKVLDAYNAGLEAIDAAPEYDDIYDALNAAIANMLAVEADRAGSVTVAISMETFVLGDYPEYEEKYGAGYIIEPTLVEAPKYTKVSTIITDLLREQYGDGETSQPWKMTGTVENDFYLASIWNGSDWLGEFTCGYYSGWMYSVNNVFPNVGASAYTVSYGDVIRWQYTVSGYGADLGTSAEWAEGDVAVVANKDELTWKVAEVNKILEETSTYLGGGVLLEAYNHADDILTEHHSTQAEVDAALAQLNNAEAAKPVIDQIKAIGEVTLDSKDAIEAAEKAYEALTEDQKALVDNYQTLADARAAYDELLRPPFYPAVPSTPSTPSTPTTPSEPEQPEETEKPTVTVDFSDVSAKDWFADSVAYVCENGLMNGTGNGKFEPYANTTRGMIVTILARLEGVDTTTGSIWYEAGRQWAMEMGISDGTSMDGQITREQLATMLYRYAQLKGYDVSARADLSSFADASGISDWAQDAMQWAVSVGLIQGSDDQLASGASATRAQVATILMRFIENLAK